MKRIGFVILTWNSEKYIHECLQSIISLDQNKIQSTVIVIDNGSTDGTISAISRVLSNVHNQSSFSCELCALEKNYGTTVSRNIGLKKLIDEDVEYICVLDSDTVVNTDAMLTLIHELDEDRSIGIIGPRMKNRNQVYQHSGRNIPTLTEKLFKVVPLKAVREKGNSMERSIPDEGRGCVAVGYLMSACWLMRRELVEEVGLLDEQIFYAPEDVDYCIRCQKAGYSVQYCYDAEISHEWQRLSRKKLFSKHNYEHIKGLVHLFRKHRYMFNTSKLELIFSEKRALIQKKATEETTV